MGKLENVCKLMLYFVVSLVLHGSIMININEKVLALFISSVAYFLQVTNAELSFQNIMKCYRTQPQAVSHVSPLLTSCKFTSACLFTKPLFKLSL